MFASSTEIKMVSTTFLLAISVLELLASEEIKIVSSPTVGDLFFLCKFVFNSGLFPDNDQTFPSNIVFVAPNFRWLNASANMQ